MKPNIDLTDNRDFSRRTRSPIIGSVLNELTEVSLKPNRRSKHLPWTMNRPVHSEYNEIVITGDKNRRKLLMDYDLCEQGLSCAKCGRNLESIPWTEKYTLCTPCADPMDYEMYVHSDFVLEDIIKLRD